MKNVVINFVPKETNIHWIFNGVLNSSGELDYFSESQIEKELNEILTKVPRKLQTVADDLWWKIVVTNTRDLEKECNVKGKVYGYTNFNNKEMVIYATKQAIRESIPHEFAHLLDYILGISKSKEWEEVYNLEVNSYKLMNSIFTTCDNKTECFADAFMAYINYESYLKRNAERTYKVIDNIFRYMDDLLNDRVIKEYKRLQQLATEENKNIAKESLLESYKNSDFSIFVEENNFESIW